jgi:HK97 family phage major capsid protein
MARITRFIGLAALATVAMPYASYLGAPRVVFDPPDGVKSAAELAAEVKSELKTATDAVKAIAEEALGKAKAGETLTNSIKEKADEALAKHTEIATRMTELEQKMVRNPGTPERRKSVGEQVTEGHEAEIAALAKGRGRFNIEVKAIISALTTDADGSAGDLIVPQRVGLVGGLERRMTVRDLLAPGRTNSNAIQYPKETGYTNSAATVTETAGTAKAQSEMKFDIATSSVTTIAHWVLATKQILDDVPMLQSYIDGRLRYGLRYVEENQLLNGGGTGTDLNGIYTQATAYSAPITPTAAGILTKVDILRLAMLQASLAELPATGIVLHPSDWADIELTKTEDGAYVFANPQNIAQPRLWGLPVVSTQAMTIDKFLVGAFRDGAQIFDREDANVEISTEDSDNFRKNLVTIRAEERLALAVYRTAAFTKGDFSDALAA